MGPQIGFTILSIALIIYFFFSERKEIPLVLVLHALLQYGFTMVLWYFKLTPSLSSILVIFLWLSSIMLIWGRSLTFGRDLFSIRLFFSVSQWAILLVLGLFISLKSPFYYVFPTAELNHKLPLQHLTYHPILKLSGNILIFTTFFHVVIHWGQQWKWTKSLIDLLPVMIYAAILLVLRHLKMESIDFPFS